MIQLLKAVRSMNEVKNFLNQKVKASKKQLHTYTTVLPKTIGASRFGNLRENCSVCHISHHPNCSRAVEIKFSKRIQFFYLLPDFIPPPNNNSKQKTASHRMARNKGKRCRKACMFDITVGNPTTQKNNWYCHCHLGGH
ncbi:hypothetical protein CEXT_5491 [Caerostris extrusa]|uniref:Uncharacterized protein n=1 Tax=Caerostris extrusa TaxID=172846 RepID=A0AAV4XIX0_CAEEX|nr:hypothetical protein CEXT_5491 [Caerostris extrusa]